MRTFLFRWPQSKNIKIISHDFRFGTITQRNQKHFRVRSFFANIGNYFYFHHFFNHHPMTTPGTTTEQVIENAVAQYVPQSQINSLKEQFTGLKILGIDDAQGYQAIKNALAQIVPVRTGIEKKRKELKQVALDYGKAVDDKAKELTSAVLEVENPLKAELDRIDRLKADAEAELRRQAEAKLADRKKQVLAAGALFNGTGYHTGSMYFTEDQIAESSDYDFVGIIQAIKNEKAVIAQKEAEEAEKRKAELAELEELRRMKAEMEAKDALKETQVGPDVFEPEPRIVEPQQADITTKDQPNTQQPITKNGQGDNIMDFVTSEPEPEVETQKAVSEEYQKGYEAMRQNVIQLLKGTPYNAMPVTISIIEKVKQL